MARYTITVKGIGRRPEVQHVDSPGLLEAKRMAFRTGADLVKRGAVPGGEWRVELTDNGNVLLGFSVQTRDAAIALNDTMSRRIERTPTAREM